MYKVIQKKLSVEQREQTNLDILYSIDAGDDKFSRETIYNTYTGLGGLHGLHQSDFDNYHEYAQAKREFEMGQFFTPHDVCRRMVELLAPTPAESVLEMCCGMGNFVNWLPNPHNVHGLDIDPDAVKVARHLYPDATFSVEDLEFFDPPQRYDLIIGNPPFNLDIKGELSQLYYLRKAYRALNPGGLLMCVVPASFLSSEFWESTRIKFIDRDFSFIGQTQLDPHAFARVGADNFETKVMVFMREARSIESRPYRAEEFVSWEVLGERIAEVRDLKRRMRLKLTQETKALNLGEEMAFQYRLDKYLYELKAHKKLRRHHPKAVALVSKFRNQKPPDDATDAQREEYERSKLTYAKVLAVIERYIREQNYVPRKEVALVRTQYGFKLKAYAPRMLDKVKHTEVKLYDLILGQDHLPDFAGARWSEEPDYQKMRLNLKRQYAAAQKAVARKQRDFERQSVEYGDMEQDPALAEYINRTSFLNSYNEISRFNDLQKHDVNLVFRKKYALLNWQQGSGKTAVAYHYARWHLVRKTVQNAVILAPAIAIEMTWEPFFARMGKPCIVATRPEHIRNAPKGAFVVISLSMLGKLKRELMRFMKLRSRKVCLVFDESDEITNPLSMRTRYTLAIFRRAKRKLLATGTTTRNNVGEMYPQVELLYNNSVNMMCECGHIYRQDKETGEIIQKENFYYGMPFPAYNGSRLFRACFCPWKASVFGIEKHDQEIYNRDQLWALIGKTILTRKFKEFAGDKYKIQTFQVEMSSAEREVYRTILEKFQEICDLYYKKITDGRKAAGLRIVRQMGLLIKACSTPQLFVGYSGDPYPGKARYIGDMVAERPEKVCIGCTTLDAVRMYGDYLAEEFPGRPLFVISGKVHFKKRLKIIRAFEATDDGILICTQQSLKSSVNIPSCDEVILEAMQWNLPKMEQFYFRFIRLDSKHGTNVNFVIYANSIEQNLMALIMRKEQMNEFIKSGQIKPQSAFFEEFGTESTLIESLMQKSYDAKGNVTLSWEHLKVS